MDRTMKFTLAVVALLLCTCSARTLKQGDEEAPPPGAAFARLVWVATGIPSCRLDPKFFSIDLDKCQGLSELAEKVAKNQTVDEVVCEPECANEYKKLNSQCARDLFDTFSRDTVDFANATLLYWGACAAQSVATSLGYPPEPTSVLTPEKQAAVEKLLGLKSAPVPAPAPEPAKTADMTAEQALEAAQAALTAAAAAVSSASAATTAVEAVRAANGP